MSLARTALEEQETRDRALQETLGLLATRKRMNGRRLFNSVMAENALLRECTWSVLKCDRLERAKQLAEEVLEKVKL